MYFPLSLGEGNWFGISPSSAEYVEKGEGNWFGISPSSAKYVEKGERNWFGISPSSAEYVEKGEGNVDGHSQPKPSDSIATYLTPSPYVRGILLRVQPSPRI